MINYIKNFALLIIFVLGGLLTNAQKARTFVYAWADFANSRLKDGIIKTCRIGLQPKLGKEIVGSTVIYTYSISHNIDLIVEELRSMPKGHRVLQLWLPQPYLDQLINNSRDRLDNLTYQKIIDQNVKSNLFWDNGAATLAALFSRFFKSLKDKNVSVDYFMLDIENSVSNWSVGNSMRDAMKAMSNTDAANTMNHTFDIILKSVKNKNGGTLSAELKTVDASKIRVSIADQQNGYIKFNAYFLKLYCDYLNVAFYHPAKKYFPNIRVSNYGHFFMNRKFKIPDNNGHKNYLGGSGCLVGNDQAPSFYGNLGESIVNYPPAGNIGSNFKRPITAFDALLYNINLLKSIRLENLASISPYISDRTFKTGNYRLGGTDYYQENLFHILLAGCNNLLFWNVSKQNSFTDQKLVYDCVRQTDSLLHYEAFDNRTPDIMNIIRWDPNFVLSKINTPKYSLWRLTPKWELIGGMPESETQYKNALKKMVANKSPLTFSIKGQRIILPKGSEVVLPKNNLSFAGYWIKVSK